MRYSHAIHPGGQPSEQDQLAEKDSKIAALEEEIRKLKGLRPDQAVHSGELPKERGGESIRETALGKTTSFDSLTTSPTSSASFVRESAEISGSSTPTAGRRTFTSVPLKNDLEIFLVFFRELMKPRQLVSELPVFLKTNKLTTLDCIRLARGFDFLSKTSDSDEDAVGLLFRKVSAGC